MVSYSEVEKNSGGKEKSAGRKASQAGTGGFQPEIYTEEDEKLLGSAKSEWRLFVDGYDSKGVRMYDTVLGKTCHQCRSVPRFTPTVPALCISLVAILLTFVAFWQAKDDGTSYFMQQLPVASWTILRRLSLHEVSFLFFFAVINSFQE